MVNLAVAATSLALSYLAVELVVAALSTGAAGDCAPPSLLAQP
jgi:hypothetical protein